MSPRDLSRVDKIMLVCSEACDEVGKCLLDAGCWVIKLSSGQAAVSRAQRENFDAAVLVSTGKVMDLAETVLNLRDLNESMQIVVVAEQGTTKNNSFAKALLAHPFPGIQLLTVAQLASQLTPLRSSGRQNKNKGRVTL